MKENLSRNEIILVGFGIAALILISLLTNYAGSTDVGDYTDSAKYFAGDYDANIRNLSPSLFIQVSSHFLPL